MNILHLLWNAAGQPDGDGDSSGICRICGQPGSGLPFTTWVRDTFTDWDKILPGDIICQQCQFAFDEANELLTKRMDKWWSTEKEAVAANPDRVKAWQKRNRTSMIPTAVQIKLTQMWGGWCIPQRMRNYSHFVIDDEWIPLSKADKARMAEILRGDFEVAVIAESGQKHIVFRAVPGIVQFEEQQIRDVGAILALLNPIQSLYAGFSKSEIETGQYKQHRIIRFDLTEWHELERQIHHWRGSLLFRLAIFLAQKIGGKDDTGITD